MPEQVSVTYIGGHDAVDVPNPEGGADIASNVKNGQSISVPEDVAKSLCEQADNWKLAKVDKPAVAPKGKE